VCSVLFCDLVGFTPLSEARDPEEVRELLSRYFELARTIVGRYGGVVEKFIGDAVMAVWGTPVATEGDAERAVRAALEIVSAVTQLGVDTATVELAARAGVVTGEVAVTLGATNEGMVAGDAVNTAARVQAEAEPGWVLVDLATRRLTASAIGFDDAGEHLLKGKAEPEHLWRVTRVMSGVGGSQRVDGLEAPLVGRDAELRTVKELFHATVERRVPRLLVVSGPAGVGKSRLGWEFEKYIDGLKDLMLWHRGRCLSYGDGVTFWALAEIVRQRFGIAEEDSPDVAAVKLTDGLEQYVPDPVEQVYVGTRIARLLGVPLSTDPGTGLDGAELFAGWRLLFERLAVVEPVVLLVEDAQYADSGLLDFLDHLIDWARDLPIFVLVFTRPEMEDARAGFGVGRNRTALTLDPLDGAAMESLVEALVPGMPKDARQAIVDRSQGIPLFAVETIRSLVDRDVVVPRDGRYRLVGDVGELTVPDSLHALLAARLDALDPEVRTLLADAAVLGSTFPAEALIAISGKDGEHVRAALAELLRREVLDISADPLSPERGTYRFAQDMLRQVAYETLSRRDRKDKHLAVAAHLRATFPNDGDEVMDVVARHYLDALTAVPTDPDVAQIREQSVDALTRAAERAERTGAPSRAATNYATAAALTADLGPEHALSTASLWELAAIAALPVGDPMALRYAEMARDGFLLGDDLRAAARARARAGAVLSSGGRLSEAREQLTDALVVLNDHPDSDTVTAMSTLATVAMSAGAADAGQISVEVLVLAQELAVDSEILARAFTGRGSWLTTAERRPEAVAYLREAARLAEQTGNVLRQGSAMINLADTLAPDHPTAAAEAARVAAAHLRRGGARRLLATAIMNLVVSLVATGAWDEAVEVLAGAVESDGLDGSEHIAVQRAWLAALRGDSDTAHALLGDVHELTTSEDPQDQVQPAVARAFLAVCEGAPALALSLARSVLVHADSLGISADSPRWIWPLAARVAHELHDTEATSDLLAMLDRRPPGQLAPMLRAERDLAHARLAAERGDPDAGKAFAGAIGSMRRMSTPYHLAHGLLDHAEFLRGDGASGAEAAVAEARELATALHCQPLVERAARAGAGVSLPS
jgi:class 3 adenylate cyclase/tetratricopeptide (TPR) repeat protein